MICVAVYIPVVIILMTEFLFLIQSKPYVRRLIFCFAIKPNLCSFFVVVAYLVYQMGVLPGCF